MSIKEEIYPLLESCNTHPVLKGVIQLISLGSIPIGPALDAAVNTHLNNYKAKKIRIFFDELNAGNLNLTTDIIENDDFLHSFFSTYDYILKSRSDDKVKRFARLIIELYNCNIDVDIFEDYNNILGELSDREFVLLSLKRHFELQNEINNDVKLNQIQCTFKYWDDFYREACNRLNIDREELNSILIRLQRTGCYKIHEKGVASGDEIDNDQVGDTTIIFKNIYMIIDQDNK